MLLGVLRPIRGLVECQDPYEVVLRQEEGGWRVEAKPARRSLGL